MDAGSDPLLGPEKGSPEDTSLLNRKKSRVTLKVPGALPEEDDQVFSPGTPMQSELQTPQQTQKITNEEASANGTQEATANHDQGGSASSSPLSPSSPAFMRPSSDDVLESMYQSLMAYRAPVDVGDPEDAVSTIDFHEMLWRETFKVRNYRVFPPFVFFMIFLAVLIFANRVDYLPDTSSYYHQRAIRDLMQEHRFREVDLWHEFYDWLGNATVSLFDVVPGDRSTPLGLILVRQLRGLHDDCGISSVYFPDTIRSARKCRDNQFSTEDIVRADPANPNVTAARWKNNFHLPDSATVSAADVSESTSFGMLSPELQTEIHLHFNLDLQASSSAPPSPASSGVNTSTSTSALPGSLTTGVAGTSNVSLFHSNYSGLSIVDGVARYIAGRDAALFEVDRMRRYSFFDGQTLSGAVDALFYHPVTKRYSRVTFLMELLPSGLLEKSVHGYTFKAQSFGGTVAHMTFASDLLVMLFVIFLIIEVVHAMKCRLTLSRTILRALVTLPEVLTIAIIVMLLYCIVLRMMTWHDVNSLEPSFDSSDIRGDYNMRKMFHVLSKVSKNAQLSYNVLSLTVVPCVIKCLIYFESIRGLNLMSQTLRLNMKDLAVVLCLSATLTLLFAITGNVLFGGFSPAFRTVNVAYGTLARLLVSADHGVFTELSETQPRVSAVFFFIFFVSLWLVMLNLLLGIIVSGVNTVQQMNEAADDARDTEDEAEGETATAAVGSDTTRSVLMTHVLLMGERYHENLRSNLIFKASACGALASAGLKAPLPWNLRVKKWKEMYQYRFNAVIALKKHERTQPLLRRRELRTCLAAIPRVDRTLFFSRVLQSAIQNQRANQREQNTQQLEISNNLADCIRSLDREVAELRDVVQGTVEDYESARDEFDSFADSPGSFSMRTSSFIMSNGSLAGRHDSMGDMGGGGGIADMVGLRRVKNFQFGDSSKSNALSKLKGSAGSGSMRGSARRKRR